MAHHGPQYGVGPGTHGLRSSPSFHGRQGKIQPSPTGLRTATSVPSLPQTTSSSTLQLQGIASPPSRVIGEYPVSPPSTSASSTLSRVTSSRSPAATPWDESQQRRLGRVTSYSAARESSLPGTPSRTYSDESQRSEKTQPPFHLRHRLKLALKELFKKDVVEEEYECQKIEDKHWTD